MNSDLAEKAHKLFAYALIGMIGAHLLGIALHTVRHKEMIGLSMITGWKQGEEGTGLASAGTPAGLAILVMIALWFIGLSSSFDFTTGILRVPLTERSVTLGGGGTDGSTTPEEHGSDREDSD